MVSNKLKERFCKDCKIPISIFEEPYFTDRLKLYDKMYNSLDKWNLFLQEISKYNNEQDYLEEYNRVKDCAIDDIKNSEAYKVFNTEDMNKYAVTHKNMPGKDIFKPSFDGKTFISIDMKKANFNTLRNYNPDIFGGAESWEQFIARYTSNRHIINSKYIRQVILGNCNPKRHITYEKYLMDKVLDKLNSLDDVVFFSNDEIVIEIRAEDKIKYAKEYKLSLEERLKEFGIPLRIEIFTLHSIHGTNGYYKEKEDGSIELKCLDSFMTTFVIRRLYNEEITDNDRVFFYQGIKSQVLEIPKIEI